MVEFDETLDALTVRRGRAPLERGAVMTAALVCLAVMPLAVTALGWTVFTSGVSLPALVLPLVVGAALLHGEARLDREPTWPLVLALVAAAAGVANLAVVMPTLYATVPAVVGVSLLVAAGLGVATVARRNEDREVRLSGTHVHARSPVRRTAVRLEQVASVRDDGRALVLVHDDGSVERIGAGFDAESRARLGERIETAATLRRASLSGPEQPDPALRRLVQVARQGTSR